MGLEGGVGEMIPGNGRMPREGRKTGRATA